MRRWLDRAKPGRSRQNVFCDGALMKVGSSQCALSGRDTELATPSRDPAKAAFGSGLSPLGIGDVFPWGC